MWADPASRHAPAPFAPGRRGLATVRLRVTVNFFSLHTNYAALAGLRAPDPSDWGLATTHTPAYKALAGTADIQANHQEDP